MKKRSKENPRMLPYVMQAVTDLKDVRGSTTRRILDQVHTAINVANIKPKPRNVVMQVKRALKHAVETGTLRHKAGKYKLIIGSKTDVKSGYRTRGRKHLSRRHKRHNKRGHFRKGRRRRRAHAPRYSPSISSATSARSSRSSTADTYAADTGKKLRSIRRRRRSVAKKSVKISGSVTRAKPKGRMRRPRQATPLPTVAKVEDCEECPMVTNEVENFEQAFANNYIEPQQETNANVTFEEPTTVEAPPECDNPECLCNLKQEPYEECNYDDSNVGQ